MWLIVILLDIYTFCLILTSQGQCLYALSKINVGKYLILLIAKCI